MDSSGQLTIFHWLGCIYPGPADFCVGSLSITLYSSLLMTGLKLYSFPLKLKSFVWEYFAIWDCLALHASTYHHVLLRLSKSFLAAVLQNLPLLFVSISVVGIVVIITLSPSSTQNSQILDLLIEDLNGRLLRTVRPVVCPLQVSL